MIDNFFETLQWDNFSNEPVVSNLVAYGDLLSIVDFHNRWVYQGSVTTPPCAQKVFWNELSTVYPISKQTLDNFRKQLDRPYYNKDGVDYNLKTYAGTSLSRVGNYREIQPEDKHNVMYVSNPELASEFINDITGAQGSGAEFLGVD